MHELVILLSLLLILIFIIWSYQSKRIKRDVNKMIEFVDRVTGGNSDNKLFIEDGRELSKLGRHISLMVEEFQRRLEEAKREKQRFEEVLKNMKEGVLIIDHRDSVLFVNESLKRFFGITAFKEGITVTELLRSAELISLIEDTRKIKDTITKEVSLRPPSSTVTYTANPEELFLLVTASPIKDQDMEGLIITFHDITKLKKLEQIRRDFVANVAHEIKTPITAIKGFAETLLDGAINDRESAIRFLEIIKKHSERLNSLVSDLLTLSSIEQGEIKLEITELNISELIDSLFALIEKKAQAKGLYLKKIISEELPLIRADRDRLSQILLNLLDNAIKFTDIGGVTVGVEKAGDKIVLYVEDTGCGIEKKHLSRLGERFYRVDRSRSRELGGTGLGLAIVKHLVKAHGWEMDIESTPNVGTKVKIKLKASG